MNYTSNDLFNSNSGSELTLNKSLGFETQPQADTDEQLKSFKVRLGLNDAAAIDLPRTENDDILPSRSTMEERFVRDYAAPQTVKKASKVSAKQKVAVLSYTAAMLVLILAVTLCSVAISGTFSAILGLRQECDVLAEQLAALDVEITEDDYQALYNKALDAGFVPIGSDNSHGYSLLDTRPAQNFPIESNWFDALCDWLGGVFGG